MAPDLYHQLDGRGDDTVLLLNGIAMSTASWAPVASILAGSHRVLRCDLRGQLLSPGDPPPTIDGHAADVAELLESVVRGPVHVVATSFGAAVATVLAARWPQLVRSMVLVAATGGFDEGMAAEVGRWRQACLDVLAGANPGVLMDTLDPVVYSSHYLEAHQEERELRRRQVAAMPRAWFEGLSRLLASARGASVGDVLAVIRCPTLVIAAEEDGFIPLARSRALGDGIAGARFEILAGAGHAVVVEQPERLAERALRFVDEVVRSGPVE